MLNMFLFHLTLWLISLKIICANDCWLEDYTVDDFKRNYLRNCHIILFYSDQCPHCAEFFPEWENIASTSCAKKGAHKIMTQIDCMDPWKNELCFKDYIRIFPTIMGYPRGSSDSFLYKGPKNKKYVNKFIEGICSPRISQKRKHRKIAMKHQKNIRSYQAV